MTIRRSLVARKARNAAKKVANVVDTTAKTLPPRGTAAKTARRVAKTVRPAAGTVTRTLLPKLIAAKKARSAARKAPTAARRWQKVNTRTAVAERCAIATKVRRANTYCVEPRTISGAFH